MQLIAARHYLWGIYDSAGVTSCFTAVMKGKINTEWHQSHRMPKNASLEQRIQWHIEHAKHCACREMPEKIKQAISGSKK